MRRTQRIQPQVTALQTKYKNDQEKLNQKLADLYRKENISPMSGCLPMLISLPVLFAMLGAMRLMANGQIAGQVFSYLSGGEPLFQGWLWVKNIWMPDSPFASIVPSLASVNGITNENWQIWGSVFSALNPQMISDLPSSIAFDFATADATRATVAAIVEHLKALPVYTDMLGTVPALTNVSLIFTQVSAYTHYNGLLLLPILAGVTQLLTGSLTPGNPPPEKRGEQARTGAFMKWFSPVFSVMVCLGSNAGFALYWVVSNLIAIAQNILLDKYFNAQDRKEAATDAHAVS